MPFYVREAETEDASDITRLSNQLGYEITPSRTLQNMIAIHENNNEIIFVAILETQVIGWIHIFQTTRLESGSFCEIGGLVIHENHQRLGVGKMLMEKAKSWCSASGHDQLRVRSNIKRSEAHSFYLSFGFRESKQQKVFEMSLSR
jgi:GNAT superfamily N-acetyltransferase